jgi:hypothetical protein
MDVDTMLTAASLFSFFALVIGWMALPASKERTEPMRVSVPRPTAAEA